MAELLLDGEAEEFDQLRDLGFELEEPQDEYSYQPDSGSIIGGRRGHEEYGIDATQDAEGRHEDKSATIIPPQQTPQRVQLSQSDEKFAKQLKETGNDDVKSQSALRSSLRKHPQLKDFDIDVLVKQGVATVSGHVPTDSAKLRVSEIIDAMPEIVEARNELVVR